MIQKFKDWLKNIEEQKLHRDIEVKVHGIKVTIDNLPYFKRVEVVKNILSSLEERELALQTEIEEVKQSKTKIGEL